MIKNKAKQHLPCFRVRLVITLLLVIFMTAGCEITVDNSEITLDELVGNWYNPNNYELVFEISKAGEEYEGYIAKTKVSCTITVDNNTVNFFGLDGVSRGSFRCSNKNGTLIMRNNGTKDFSDIRYSSWFVKSDRILDGDNVQVELIGKWYSDTISSSTPSFEIFRTSKITLSGDASVYDIIVSGNTVSVFTGVIQKGAFRYSIRHGVMSTSDGTDICSGLSYFSPFVKRASEDEENEDEEY